MRVQWQTRRFYPDLYGGLEVRGRHLVQAWRDMGHQVSVLCENYPTGPALRDEPIESVRCLRIPCRAAGALWRMAPVVRTLRWAWWQRRAEAADVLVAAYPECVLSARLARRGPVLYNCVNTAPLPHASVAEHWIARQRQWLIRRAAAAADSIVVASQCLRRQLIALAPESAGKTAIVPHGVDINRWEDAQPSRTLLELRAQNLLPIVYLGRLSPEKGVDLAIEAFGKMRRQDRAVLVLVGIGPAEAQLRRQAAQTGMGRRVLFAGSSSAPEEWLAGAAVLVLPSRVEAFGTVMLEAMAAGLPCVSWLGGTNGPPVAADEIIVDGQTGFCAPAFDTLALAGHLDALVGNATLRAQMGRAGQRLVRQRYTLRQMAESYAELAWELLNRTSRRVGVSCPVG